jgi:hypothetical protein
MSPEQGMRTLAIMSGLFLGAMYGLFGGSWALVELFGAASGKQSLLISDWFVWALLGSVVTNAVGGGLVAWFIIAHFRSPKGEFLAFCAINGTILVAIIVGAFLKPPEFPFLFATVMAALVLFWIGGMRVAIKHFARRTEASAIDDSSVAGDSLRSENRTTDV